MAGMGFMIAAASRKRDNKGRYMDDRNDRRMGNDHSTRMDDNPEMRRRRDDRGRYMDGGAEMAYRPWPDPHTLPYLDRPGMADGDRMRDRNVVNIRDYQDKRRIGFGVMDDDEEGMDMRHYGRRFDPDRMSMGRSGHQSTMMGGSDAEGGDHLTREEAEAWVKGMHSEDGKTGGRWPYQEIKQYAGNFGIQGEDKVVEFFAVMNALYTDYCKVAKKHGVDKVDFWADLAKAFIQDKDAEPGKVKRYYECIAKHNE